MGISFWQIAIVVVLVVLLFGRGKISSLMGDVAKGIKSFKAGMKEGENEEIEVEEETVKSKAKTSKKRTAATKNKTK